MCTAVARLLATVAALATAVSGAKIVYEAGELKLQDPDEVGSVVVSPLPHTYLKPSDIPAEWNPHDIDGITLVTSDLNQHIPQCNSHTHTHTHTQASTCPPAPTCTVARRQWSLPTAFPSLGSPAAGLRRRRLRKLLGPRANVLPRRSHQDCLERQRPGGDPVRPGCHQLWGCWQLPGRRPERGQRLGAQERRGARRHLPAVPG
jgi:hypothetical protein